MIMIGVKVRPTDHPLWNNGSDLHPPAGWHYLRGRGAVVLPQTRDRLSCRSLRIHSCTEIKDEM